MRKSIHAGIAAVLMGTLLLTGCGTAASTGSGSAAVQTADEANADTAYSRDIFAMDTYMTLTAYGASAQPAVEEAIEEIERLDALLSIGSVESEISVLNETGQAEVSEDTLALIEQALRLHAETGGAFDITILPVMELWGFTTQDYAVPDADSLAETMRQVDAARVQCTGSTVTLGEGQRIDLGGIAKGYTSGRVMDIFRSHGVTSGMVSLGGNVQLLGSKTDGSAWRVGIQNPDDTGDMLGVLEAEDCAVITSGGYERYFEQDGEIYHHIIDPSTGRPSDSGLVSVTIVSPDGTLADCLSTALFVMGAEKAAAYWRAHDTEFEAVLAEENGTIYVTEGIADRFACDLPVTIIERT